MVSPSFIKRTKNESFTSGSVKTQNDLINAGMNARSGIHVNLIKICSGLSVLYVQHIYVGYQPKHHVQENKKRIFISHPEKCSSNIQEIGQSSM